jgi:hypothetical protein
MNIPEPKDGWINRDGIGRMNKKDELCAICGGPIKEILSKDIEEFCVDCIKLMHETMGWGCESSYEI